MAVHVKLSDIVDALEMAHEEASNYLNTSTGEVVMVTVEEMQAAEEDTPPDEFPEWQRENIVLAGEIFSDTEGQYLLLPSKFDIHEWEIMKRFCLSVDDPEIADSLLDAVHGRGAFRRFKNRIYDFGIEEKWYAYRGNAFREMAIEWCENNGIQYVDDAPQPSLPEETEPVVQASVAEKHTQDLPEAVVAKIEERLRQIEADESVRILYACESGSRAWGFASPDSDYDVRFIYVRPKEWYLSIDVENRRDVIEPKNEGILDLSGWDLRKTLQLLRKSNPPLLEWLRSPIIYLEIPPIVSELRRLAAEYYSPAACHYHYRSMARNNYRDYTQHDEVPLKKYFYILRPLLAMQWIEAGYGGVPMEFQALVDRMVPAGPLLSAIEDLLRNKRDTDEQSLGPRIPAIADFIDAELERLETTTPDHPKTHKTPDALNNFFRETLAKIWEKAESP